MIDPVLLRTFLVVAQGNSFSEAGRKLALRQSTVSDHIRRLEQHLRRQLFVRDTHSVTLTAEGEALIGFAETILDTSESAERFFAGSPSQGRLRFGASEDLVTTFLPEVIESFMRDHPKIDLELTVALSTNLRTRFEAGELDLVFCKRWPGEEHGDLVWRDEVTWVARTCPESIGGGSEPLPLVLYRPPSITRSVVIAALTQAGINWRLACTGDSLTGLVAATRAGLGVTAFARRLVPPGLMDIGDAVPLPKLGTLDFILLRHGRGLREPVAQLVAAIKSRSRG